MTGRALKSLDEAAPGDIVVYRDRIDYGIARIDLLRERHVTCFPWRVGDRRWGKGRARIERSRVLAVLHEGADAAAIGEHLNIIKNQREMQKGAAQRYYHLRVRELVGLEQLA